MSSDVETPEKQVLNRIGLKFSRGKRDRVDHNRIYGAVSRSIITMRRA